MTHKERPRYVFDALKIYIYRDVIDFKKSAPTVDQSVISETFFKIRDQIIKNDIV